MQTHMRKQARPFKVAMQLESGHLFNLSKDKSFLLQGV